MSQGAPPNSPSDERTLYEQMATSPFGYHDDSEIASRYRGIKGRTNREKFENAVDTVIDTVRAPIQIALLPVTLPYDIITGILAGRRLNASGEFFTSRLMASREDARAWERMSADRNKYNAKLRAGKKQDSDK